MLYQSHRTFFYLFLFFLLLTAGCDTSPISHLSIKANYSRSIEDNFPETEFRLRQATISDINYEINMDLTQHDRYAGTVEIRFNYKPTEYPLTIDFKGGEIQRILTNNNTTGIDYNGQFVTIPATMLNDGANRIKLHFSHGFGKDEPGLNRYYDSNDQNVYLYFKQGYSQASQLFPLFEQPDLPAAITALYTTYDDWQLVSSLKTDKVSDRGNFKIWHQSGLDINNEQLTLYAGDWHLWEGQSKQKKVNILVRDSLKEQIPIRYWYSGLHEAIDKVNEFSPFSTEEIHIVFLPGLYSYQQHYQKVMALSEQPVLNFSNYSPDWNRHITRHLVSSSLQNKPLSERWTEAWLTEHILDQVSAGSNQRTFTHINPELTQAMINPVSSDLKQQVINQSNFYLKHHKSRLLLDGLYLIAIEEDINEAIIDFLAQPDVTTLNFLESIQHDSSLAMSDWASQWLTVGGISTLITSRYCEKGLIKQLNLVQQPMETVPIVRQLNIRLSYELENDIKTEQYEMTSDRMNFKHLDNLTCDTPILVQAEKYLVNRSDNQQESLLDLASRHHEFPIFDLFNEAVNSQNQPNASELTSWIHLLRSRLETLETGEVQSVLKMIDSWLIDNHFTRSDQLESALSRFSNRLYQMSLNKELTLHQRLELFKLHLELASDKTQMDRLFTWIVGKSEPTDLARSDQLRLKALEKLIVLNYERLDILNDYFQDQVNPRNQYDLQAVRYSQLDTEKQINYLETFLTTPDFRQEQFMPVLNTLLKRQSTVRTNLLNYIIGKYSQFEQRMGSELLQYWIQPSLFETCQSELTKSVSGLLSENNLSDLSKDWLSQYPLMCEYHSPENGAEW